MIYCHGCEREIEPVHMRDDIGYPIDVCPINPDHEIEIMSKCQKCGSPATLHEMYCDDCKAFMYEKLKEPVNELTEIFDFERSEINKILVEIVEVG